MEYLTADFGVEGEERKGVNAGLRVSYSVIEGVGMGEGDER